MDVYNDQARMPVKSGAGEEGISRERFLVAHVTGLFQAAAKMRSRGRIIKWDEDRGFGFIAAEGGGEDVFLHRRSISGGERTPSVGAIVDFELDHDAQLRRRAIKAVVSKSGAAASLRRSHGISRPRRTSRSSCRSPFGFFSILLTLVVPFAVLGDLYISARRGWIPQWVALLYLTASGFAVAAYALDKYRAHKERWRISESTLHLLEMLGGWPGAFAAQRLFRHKTRKLSFQITYWLIVLAHVAFWSWFAANRLGWIKS